MIARVCERPHHGSCVCPFANVVEERERDEHCAADDDDGAEDETLAANPVVERSANHCRMRRYESHAPR